MELRTSLLPSHAVVQVRPTNVERIEMKGVVCSDIERLEGRWRGKVASIRGIKGPRAVGTSSCRDHTHRRRHHRLSLHITLSHRRAWSSRHRACLQTALELRFGLPPLDEHGQAIDKGHQRLTSNLLHSFAKDTAYFLFFSFRLHGCPALC